PLCQSRRSVSVRQDGTPQMGSELYTTARCVVTSTARRQLSSSELISRIDELLEVRYRSADLGNLDDPLSETVYILLSKQTREGSYRSLFRNLRLVYPRWIDVLQTDDSALEALLKPGGFQR